MWEILLIIALVALLGEKEAAQQMLTTFGFGVVLAVLLIAGVVLYVNFPVFTMILLGVMALVAVALLCRWVYRRFFSPEAKLAAGRSRLRKRYYAVMDYIARMETGTYERDWALPKAVSGLPALYAEFERYKQGPPEMNMLGKPMDWQFLIDDLNQRLQALQSLNENPR